MGLNMCVFGKMRINVANSKSFYNNFFSLHLVSASFVIPVNTISNSNNNKLLKRNISYVLGSLNHPFINLYPFRTYEQKALSFN